MQRAAGAPLFLVDLAVPRDLDPAIHELDGCYLYNVDDLQAVVAETLAGRRQEAARAEGIVAAEAERSSSGRPRSTSCRRSRRCAPAPRRSARRAAQAEARLGRLSDEQRSRRRVAHRADRQQAPPPADGAHEAGAAAADGVVYAEAVRHLFGLGEEEQQ